MFMSVNEMLSNKGRISFIKSKVYNMIINNSSCTNIASTTLVRKLKLTITKHAKPYKLQWLNEYEEVMVIK